MDHPLQQLIGQVSGEDWPALACPTCRVGSLPYAKATLYESPSSIRNHDDENFSPDWVNGTFVLVSTCSNHRCSQSVIFQGDWEVAHNSNSDHPKYGEYGDLFEVRTVTPPFDLLRIPGGSPDATKAAIAAAAKIIWLDPSSAAGRLRTAVERVLDERGISPRTRNGGWKSPGCRIEEFKSANELAGKAMMAVKWIGNSGAHGDDRLTSNEVLDGATMLELALKVIYDTPSAAMIAHIEAIIAAKGPLKP